MTTSGRWLTTRDTRDIAGESIGGKGEWVLSPTARTPTRSPVMSRAAAISSSAMVNIAKERGTQAEGGSSEPHVLDSGADADHLQAISEQRGPEPTSPWLTPDRRGRG